MVSLKFSPSTRLSPVLILGSATSSRLLSAALPVECSLGSNSRLPGKKEQISVNFQSKTSRKCRKHSTIAQKDKLFSKRSSALERNLIVMSPLGAPINHAGREALQNSVALSSTTFTTLSSQPCALQCHNITDHYKPARRKITTHHNNPYLLQTTR